MGSYLPQHADNDIFQIIFFTFSCFYEMHRAQFSDNTADVNPKKINLAFEEQQL